LKKTIPSNRIGLISWGAGADFFGITSDAFPEWELFDRSHVFVTTFSEPVDPDSKYDHLRIIVMMIFDLFEWNSFQGI
jgi:hypothetical protein